VPTVVGDRRGQSSAGGRRRRGSCLSRGKMTGSRLVKALLGVGATLAFALNAAAQSRDYSSLYDDAILREAAPRYRDWIVGSLENVLLAKLTPEERSTVRGVRVLVPLRGTQRQPLEFYAESGTKTIFMPAQSIRFLYDLSLAF